MKTKKQGQLLTVQLLPKFSVVIMSGMAFVKCHYYPVRVQMSGLKL